MHATLSLVPSAWLIAFRLTESRRQRRVRPPPTDRVNHVRRRAAWRSLAPCPAAYLPQPSCNSCWRFHHFAAWFRYLAQPAPAPEKRRPGGVFPASRRGRPHPPIHPPNLIAFAPRFRRAEHAIPVGNECASCSSSDNLVSVNLRVFDLSPHLYSSTDL